VKNSPIPYPHKCQLSVRAIFYRINAECIRNQIADISLTVCAHCPVKLIKALTVRKGRQQTMASFDDDISKTPLKYT